MSSLCLLFRVHQPYQLKRYTGQEITVSHNYEDAAADELAINTLSDECYLPANRIILSLIAKHKGRFKVSYSISGTVLELLRKYRPEIIDSFQQLVATGCVEILAETYYHSLSFLYSKNEFQRQVKKHHNLIDKLFGVKPAVFRNTEMIYNNDLAKSIAGMGYKGIVCDENEGILGGRPVNQVYSAPGNKAVGLLLRNASLSDDIAFRFDDRHWNEYPLTAEKFANWLHIHPAGTEVVNLFIDYDTWGIHKKAEKGIFDFLEQLPNEVIANDDFIFSTPTEILNNFSPKEIYDSPHTISWGNKKKESYVWCENMMQNNSVKKIYSIENKVLQDGSPDAIDTWGRLQSADYFSYMSEDHFKIDAGKKLHHFNSPREVFQYYTNILTDFEISLIRKSIERDKKQFPDKSADLRLF